MLKILFGHFVMLILLVSCASFKESHTCDWSFKINEGNYQACRSPKTNTFALYDVDNDKVLLKDSRNIYWFGKPGVVIVEYKGYIEKLYGKNLSEKEVIETTSGLSEIGGGTLFRSARNYKLIYVKNGFRIFDKGTGIISEIVNYPISHSDQKTTYGDPIPAVLEYAFGDILVRGSVTINRNSVSRYQLFDKSAQAQLKREVLAKGTRLYRNSGQYLLFKDIDVEMSIVRPIASGIESDFFESRNIEGVILLDEMTWKLNKQDNKTPILPSFKNFIIVVNHNGRKTYYKSSYIMDKNKTIDEQLQALKQALIPSQDKPSGDYSDLEIVTYVYKDQFEKLYEQKRPLLKNHKNEYVVADRNGNLNQYFSTKNEFQNKVSKLRSDYNKYIADIEEKRRKELAYRESRRKLDQAIAEQQNREEQLRRENREIDERNRKAAKDAAWSGVADKIQNAGRASKSKADCIRKRTQTKKDFLDKKQGWYQTGGCQ